jgi:hypothetical protein
MPGCDFPSRSFLKFQPYCFSWGQVKTIEGLRRTKFLIQLQNSLKATRLLELADTAIGTKKQEAKKKKSATGAVHSSEETEPYSN